MGPLTDVRDGWVDLPERGDDLDRQDGGFVSTPFPTAADGGTDGSPSP